MGVQIYIRARSGKAVSIAGHVKKCGTLRRLCKVTEVDEYRMAGIEAGRAAYKDRRAPSAMVVPDEYRIAVASNPARPVPVYAVIGWKAGLYDITDWEWGGRPVLGYAVENIDGEFVLHECRDDELLYPVDIERAAALGLAKRPAPP